MSEKVYRDPCRSHGNAEDGFQWRWVKCYRASERGNEYFLQQIERNLVEWKMCELSGKFISTFGLNVKCAEEFAGTISSVVDLQPCQPQWLNVFCSNSLCVYAYRIE